MSGTERRLCQSLVYFTVCSAGTEHLGITEMKSQGLSNHNDRLSVRKYIVVYKFIANRLENPNALDVKVEGDEQPITCSQPFCL